MLADCRTMARRFKHALTPFKVVVSLPCAAVLFVVFAGATLIPQSAWSADLRLQTKPAAQQETPLDRRKRLFEEFLRHLQKRNQDQ
ncbi:MAG: hypothetical protein WBZ30_26170 [Bradyrhizobium sp.]